MADECWRCDFPIGDLDRHCPWHDKQCIDNECPDCDDDN